MIRALKPSSDMIAFAKWVVVGTMNTGFAYLVYATALFAGAQPWLANLFGLILGILFSYFSVGKLVFGITSVKSFLRFVLSWLIIYALQTGCIYILMHFGISALLAGLLMLPATAVTSYIVQRVVVFR